MVLLILLALLLALPCKWILDIKIHCMYDLNFMYPGNFGDLPRAVCAIISPIQCIHDIEYC